MLRAICTEWKANHEFLCIRKKITISWLGSTEHEFKIKLYFKLYFVPNKEDEKIPNESAKESSFLVIIVPITNCIFNARGFAPWGTLKQIYNTCLLKMKDFTSLKLKVLINCSESRVWQLNKKLKPWRGDNNIAHRCSETKWVLIIISFSVTLRNLLVNILKQNNESKPETIRWCLWVSLNQFFVAIVIGSDLWFQLGCTGVNWFGHYDHQNN